MALTSEQKEQLRKERVSTVKKGLIDEEIAKKHQKQKELKDKMAQIHAEKVAAGQDERSRESISEDEKAAGKKGKKLWDKVMSTADTLIEGRYEGYNDLGLAMMVLVRAAMELHKAMYYDPIEVQNFIPKYGDTIVAVIDKAKSEAKAYAWDMTIGKVDEALTKLGINESELPTLRFQADFDDNGKLTSTVTKNAQPADELSSAFDKGIQAWASCHGFTKLHSGVYEDEAHNLLNKAKFEELNSDPDESLESFLSGRFNMSVQHSHRP